ncbi:MULTISPECIES: DciA family protein [unclassified Diaminobutyricimonas]|uniref:DUF721 domain-containing protein n=1 Tax=unclassified Diaminobutyricimonas TaxID=2643261 RepID=UPI0012F484DD|nr:MULTISPECIES: DciA family protein [unclassified Diaminobutyricimonas]
MIEDPTSEARNVYLRFRRVFGDPALRTTDSRRRASKAKEPSVPFGSGRDPQGVGDVLDALTAKLGWNSPLAQSDLMLSWPDLVGAETAAHSTPTGITEGVLNVKCDSTAWATQLRLMRSMITTQIIERYPDAGIQSVRFEGPNAPSWKRGPRAIPGRGPRDTYG